MTSLPVAATETQSSRKQETSCCLKFHVSQFGAERRHDGFIFLSGETPGSCWIINVGVTTRRSPAHRNNPFLTGVAAPENRKTGKPENWKTGAGDGNESHASQVQLFNQFEPTGG